MPRCACVVLSLAEGSSVGIGDYKDRLEDLVMTRPASSRHGASLSHSSLVRISSKIHTYHEAAVPLIERGPCRRGPYLIPADHEALVDQTVPNHANVTARATEQLILCRTSF